MNIYIYICELTPVKKKRINSLIFNIMKRNIMKRCQIPLINYTTVIESVKVREFLDQSAERLMSSVLTPFWTSNNVAA